LYFNGDLQRYSLFSNKCSADAATGCKNNSNEGFVEEVKPMKQKVSFGHDCEQLKIFRRFFANGVVNILRSDIGMEHGERTR